MGADIWVMDPAVQTVVNSIDARLCAGRGRSIPGVKFARAILGTSLARLHDSTYQAINVIGWMTTTLFGLSRSFSEQYRRHLRWNGFLVVRM